MRDREVIAKSGAIKNDLLLEVLLDIRDLLKPQVFEEPAPLYVSDKPPRKKRKK